MFHDLLGMYEPTPKFSRQFAPVGKMIENGLSSYVSAVRDSSFPASVHTVTMDDNEWTTFKAMVSNPDESITTSDQADETTPPAGTGATSHHGLTTEIRAPTLARICVIGSGALGSLLAGRLAAAPSSPDVFVLSGWDARRNAINASGGITVVGAADNQSQSTNANVDNPARVRAFGSVGEVLRAAGGSVDLAVVAVKSSATLDAASACAHLVKRGGIALTVQNGE